VITETQRPLGRRRLHNKFCTRLLSATLVTPPSDFLRVYFFGGAIIPERSLSLAIWVAQAVACALREDTAIGANASRASTFLVNSFSLFGMRPQ